MRSKIMLAACCVLFIGVVGCTSTTTKKTETKPAAPKGGAAKVMTLKSSGFGDGEAIPLKYANQSVQGAENLSPPLEWSDPPDGSKSFALVVVDTNPNADNWIHWAVINIPVSAKSLAEGASGTDKMPEGSVELNNTYGTPGYNGPGPPPGTGSHNYEFILYALDKDNIGMTENMTYESFVSGVKQFSLGSVKITGKFER